MGRVNRAGVVLLMEKNGVDLVLRGLHEDHGDARGESARGGVGLDRLCTIAGERLGRDTEVFRGNLDGIFLGTGVIPGRLGPAPEQSRHAHGDHGDAPWPGISIRFSETPPHPGSCPDKPLLGARNHGVFPCCRLSPESRNFDSRDCRSEASSASAADDHGAIAQQVRCIAYRRSRRRTCVWTAGRASPMDDGSVRRWPGSGSWRTAGDRAKIVVDAR